jgi:hypothetical protein
MSPHTCYLCPRSIQPGRKERGPILRKRSGCLKNRRGAELRIGSDRREPAVGRSSEKCSRRRWQLHGAQWGSPAQASITLWSPAGSTLRSRRPAASNRWEHPSDRLVEVPLAQPLVPLLAGFYTRSDGPMSPVVKAAAQIIIQMARRIAATGDLRSTAPILPAGHRPQGRDPSRSA